MENNFFYQVAGHRFRLSFSEDFGKDALGNYTPFLVPEGKGGYLFRLSVVDDLPDKYLYEQVGQFDNDIAAIGVFKSENGYFRFHIGYPGSRSYCAMDVDAAFRVAQVKLPAGDKHRFFCLNNCLMLLYAFSTANLDTLMMHASVIKNGADGFMFLGKSGTGKSTHSRLWLDHVEGSELLNDDNPVVRVFDGKAIVYGTPWSGKTPCYRNEEALLKGIVKLQQAPLNQIKTLSLLQAYAIVLPACSSMRWEEEIASGIHRAVEKLIGMVPCYRLECLPDKAAADLSASTIKK
ncbi:hypothetical protein [Proteiniphilum sp. X52]|uniref:hypothetical protein n=1 Tax=Proteiniphilum sp. X52 TaxID=2382159 RepID=UPI000F0A9006|nr:hypothetical protein [Proteiniphilum sp. X52]RNC64561.1 hypothetical protein D7D25_10635 [Proteiniphilum sp. X52]